MTDSGRPTSQEAEQTNSQKKMALMKAVRERCKQWDSFATTDAIRAVSDHGSQDEESSMARAKRSLGISIELQKAGVDIIDLCHQHWPT